MISVKNNIPRVIEIIANFFSEILDITFFNSGIITYTKNKLENPKNSTERKHIYPLMFPQFHISVL